MKKGLIFIIILALLAGGYFAFLKVYQNNSSDTQQKTDTGPATEIGNGVRSDSKPIQNDTTNSWKLQITDDYTIKHPNEANADLREDEIVITYMGEKQKASGRTQTELFDGYSVRVAKILDDSITNIEDLATRERENAVENCDYEGGKISSLQSISIGGAIGFQYSAVNCYINYTETLIVSNNVYFRISQSYVGDESDYSGYKKTTDDIFSTLNLTR